MDYKEAKETIIKNLGPALNAAGPVAEVMQVCIKALEFMEGNTVQSVPSEEKEIIQAAINIYGEVSQIQVTVEECSELQKALLKYIRSLKGDKHLKPREELIADIKEEMADVSIMLDQMCEIFGPCDIERDFKLKRMKDRLSNEVTLLA